MVIQMPLMTAPNGSSMRSSCRQQVPGDAELGNAAVLLAGDLNTTLGASEVLQRCLNSGALQDFSLPQGRDHPTCFPSKRSVGTRIDYMLGNSIAAATLGSFELVEDSGIPTHRPLRCKLKMELAQQSGVRFRKPAPIPLDWEMPDKEAEKAMATRTSL